MPKVYRISTFIFAAWLLVWLRLSWPAVQDDAFIHLRYAANLLQHHLISYDGVHQDYGTSSLLYVALLAMLRSVWVSPVLPRAVSSIFHVVLFVGLAIALGRALKGAPKLAWAHATLLMAVLVTPMAVRWLDDGMETSLTLCLISLIAFAISGGCHAKVFSNRSAMWLFALGLIATLTRVEYLLLFGLTTLMLYSARRSLVEANEAEDTALEVLIRSAAPLAGSLLAALLIVLKMHALTPDTAVAKADGHAQWIGTLHATASVFGSSMSFGVVFLLLWMLTAATVIVHRQKLTLPMVLANSPLLIMVAMAAARGQQVQGIRYFAWGMLFPILWNVLELRWDGHEFTRLQEIWLRYAAYGVAVVLVCLMPTESRLLYHLFRTRAQALAEFRGQHLDQLHAMNVVAFDVGYIGYFTESPLCDMAGLVNGRADARLSFHERVVKCAARKPQYAFVSLYSMGDLNNVYPLRGWSICSEYDFANLRTSDIHYLIASPDAKDAVCAASRGTPQPLEPVLHPESTRSSLGR
jgi:hypothetical protein